MKQTLIGIMMVLSLIHAKPAKLDATTLEEIKKGNEVLKNPNLTIKSGVDLGSVYFLKVAFTAPSGDVELSRIFYDKANQNIYIGQGFTKEGAPMGFTKDVKAIQEGISFSYGKGSKELYVITDPQCPYCIKFEKAVHGKLKDYKVHVILFPLSFHKQAPMMVEWIMQGKDDEAKYQRLVDITVNGSKAYRKLIAKGFKYSADVNDKMQKAKIAFAELEARGTPALFDAQFRPVSAQKLIQSTTSKFKPALHSK